jgi:hypothetical protein
LRSLVLVLALAGCGPSRPPTPTPAAPEPVHESDDGRYDAGRALLRRIGIIGASQTAGFGDGVALQRVLDAAILVEHECFDVSSSAHFLRPLDIGRAEVLATSLRQPTLVLAVDFLFWYAYGNKPLERREADLQIAFDLLESFGVPVLVGDLPDVAGASEQMIAPQQIPPPDQIDGLNRTIRAWADARESVVVLPLRAWTEQMRAEEPVALWGSRVEPRLREVMQWDGLHPSARGQALLGLLVLQELEQRLAPLGPNDLRRDAPAFMNAFAPAPEPSPYEDLPPPPQPGGGGGNTQSGGGTRQRSRRRCCNSAITRSRSGSSARRQSRRRPLPPLQPSHAIARLSDCSVPP